MEIKGYKEVKEEGTEAIAIINGKKYEWFHSYDDDSIETKINGVKQETAHFVFTKWNHPNGDFFMNIIDALEEVEDIDEVDL